MLAWNAQHAFFLWLEKFEFCHFRLRQFRLFRVCLSPSEIHINNRAPNIFVIATSCALPVDFTRENKNYRNGFFVLTKRGAKTASIHTNHGKKYGFRFACFLKFQLHQKCGKCSGEKIKFKPFSKMASRSKLNRKKMRTKIPKYDNNNEHLSSM